MSRALTNAVKRVFSVNFQVSIGLRSARAEMPLNLSFFGFLGRLPFSTRASRGSCSASSTCTLCTSLPSSGKHPLLHPPCGGDSRVVLRIQRTVGSAAVPAVVAGLRASRAGAVGDGHATVCSGIRLAAFAQMHCPDWSCTQVLLLLHWIYLTWFVDVAFYTEIPNAHPWCVVLC